MRSPRSSSFAAALAPIAACAVLSASCVGTTGGDVFDFPAAAAGPPDAVAGAPFELTNDRGWRVVLTRATLHVGAVYLDESQPVSGAQNTSCVLPGTYVAQVTGGIDVDLLSPDPQPFTTPGHGTTLPALVGQVWLTGGRVDQADDRTPILTLAGAADRAGDVRPFTATITIGANRRAGGSALAGANPICKQRIVSPIPAGVTLGEGGSLLLRADPRGLFVNVDFAALAPSSSGYAFSDDSSDQPSANLYQNLRAAGGVYTFSWIGPR